MKYDLSKESHRNKLTKKADELLRGNEKKKTKRKKKNIIKKGIPESLKKWRKKERYRYINMMAKNNELDIYFYVVKLFNDNENFIKVGISIDIEQRLKSIPYKYKILNKAIFDLNKAWLIETWSLNILYSKNLRYKPKIYFQGYTECFTTGAILALKKLLSQNSIY